MSDELRQNLEKPDEKKGKSDDQTNQPKNEVPPPISVKSGLPPSIPPPPKCNNESSNNSNPRKAELPNWCDILTLLLEFLGIIGLAIYCVYTVKEWSVFSREANTFDDEVKAVRMNSTNEQNMAELEERAWINPGKITRALTDTNTIVYYTLTITNVGKTPALRLVVEFEPAATLNLIHTNDIEPTNVAKQYLGAGDGTKVDSPHFPFAIIENDIVQNQPLYLWGYIWFDDVFGHSHRVRFCYLCDVSQNLQFPAKINNDCDTDP
jgi:hypothetical protein